MAITASLFRAGYGVLTEAGILHHADPQTMLLACATSWLLGRAIYARVMEGRLRLTGKELVYATLSGLFALLIVSFLIVAAKYGEAGVAIPIANLGVVVALLVSALLRVEPITTCKVLSMLFASGAAEFRTIPEQALPLISGRDEIGDENRAIAAAWPGAGAMGRVP